jgi:NAD+ diphosphatase
MAFVPDISSRPEREQQRFFVVHPRGLVARLEGAQVVLPELGDLAAFGLSAGDAHRFGTLDDSDVFVIPWAVEVPTPFEILSLRALAGVLDKGLFGVVGHAMHTADWLSTSRFCGRCGARTERVASERCMACQACGLQLYPRISPAIITLVRKGDHALLASNAKFPGAFYSTLAGFAEIGESLEETLIREVREEAGIAVTNVRYFGSQPWPFPNSLMIAFTADWQAGEIAIDPRELADANWFSADDLPPVPPPISIARQLIDAWVAEVQAKRGA